MIARPLPVVSLDTSMQQLLKIGYCCSIRDRRLAYERTEAAYRNAMAKGVQQWEPAVKVNLASRLKSLISCALTAHQQHLRHFLHYSYIYRLKLNCFQRFLLLICIYRENHCIYRENHIYLTLIWYRSAATDEYSSGPLVRNSNLGLVLVLIPYRASQFQYNFSSSVSYWSGWKKASFSLCRISYLVDV